MTGLVLKLGPKERVLINGAVVENGDRRNRLHILTPDVNILRLRDAIHPDEVTTPVRRVCYIAQLVLSGDATLADARPQILRGIEQLSQIFRDPDSRTHLDAATSAMTSAQTYRALKALRALLPREERLLGATRGAKVDPTGTRAAAERSPTTGTTSAADRSGGAGAPSPETGLGAPAAHHSEGERARTTVAPPCAFTTGASDKRVER